MTAPGAERAVDPGRTRLYLIALLSASLLIKGNIAAGAVERPLIWDELTYVEIATRLADARLSPAAFPGAHRAPGYPYFLALVITFAGSRVIFMKLAQAVVSVVAGLLLFRLVRRRSGDGAALAAAAMFLLLPELVVFSVSLWAETLFILFLIPALDLSGRLLQERSHGIAAACGAAWGVAVLVRSGYEGMPILLAGLLLARPPRRPALTAGLLLVGAYLAVVAPWMVRNKLLFDHFQIASNPWIVMWHGNRDLSTPVYAPYYAIPDENAREAKAREEAFRWIRSQGWRWLPIKAHRTLKILWGLGSYPLRDAWLGVEGPMTPGRARGLLALHGGSFVLLLVLGVWGWSRLPSDGAWIAGSLLVLYTSLQSLVMASHSRYRLPLFVPIIIFAAEGLFRRGAPVPRSRRLVGAALFACILYAVASSARTDMIRDLSAGLGMRDHFAPGEAPLPLDVGDVTRMRQPGDP